MSISYPGKTSHLHKSAVVKNTRNQARYGRISLMRPLSVVLTLLPLLIFGECEGPCDICSMSIARGQLGAKASEVRPFSVTGTVTARAAASGDSNICRFFLYDQTGFGELFCDRAIVPEPGKVVAVRGVIAPIAGHPLPVLFARSIVMVGTSRQPTPRTVSADQLGDGNMTYRTVRVCGHVNDVRSDADGSAQMSLSVDGRDTTVLLPDGHSFRPLVGARISLVGVCLPPAADAPNEPRIVLAEPKILETVSPAPVASVDSRILFSIIGILAAAIFVVLARYGILRRMSRLRINERTRLAVELHDSLSQNLAAVAMQISSAKSARQADDPAAENRHWSAAEKMLDSCRNELRHCLWDLRGDTMDQKDFSEAIRKTLAPISRAATISVDSNVPRSTLSDLAAHSVLMILRELTTNALLHGRADNIMIQGVSQGNVATFSVRDNGTGFDPESCPGLADGHFGLEGIRHRLEALHGTFDIVSRTGAGSTATFTIRIGS